MNNNVTNTTEHRPETAAKACVRCGVRKPLGEFASRGGRRSGRKRRRGTCRSCRLLESKLEPVAIESKPEAETAAPSPEAKPKRRRRRRKAKKAPAQLAALPSPLPASAVEARPASKRAKPIRAAGTNSAMKPKPDPKDADGLIPTRKGLIRMRGKTDSGRSYYQEIDPEFARILVREHAAYVVNRSTIRRIYSNREFRRLILTRDRYTCRFCGEYGDTIDHLLPRAKGGHTTPVNCVCACNECNQSKADRDLDEFTESLSTLRGRMPLR
ncbi:HNH endonuclease [Paenibacillaceae bacterium WGS1546]|uniref:HNH endonuclease n=1 Tax=Cohnella sp. WGS1546 TaxID=3366810 RepID=UPI00372D362F